MYYSLFSIILHLQRKRTRMEMNRCPADKRWTLKEHLNCFFRNFSALQRKMTKSCKECGLIAASNCYCKCKKEKKAISMKFSIFLTFFHIKVIFLWFFFFSFSQFISITCISYPTTSTMAKALHKKIMNGCADIMDQNFEKLRPKFSLKK